MFKILQLISLTILFLYADSILPTTVIKSDGEVIDMIVKNGSIYATTDTGKVDIYDFKTKKLKELIVFKKIKDIFGDMNAPRVFSVDVMGDKVILASQGTEGFSRVYIYYDKKLHRLFDENDRMPIMKVRYIDKDRILLGLLSSELVLYDLKNRKVIYDKQVSESKFSDFRLDKKKRVLAFSDESGSVKLIQVKDAKILKTFSGQNLDNVYQLDYKNHIIAVASKDKKCGIYKDDGSMAYHKKSNFLVYSTGLSPSGKLCGYASDDKNDITIFNTCTKENLQKLTKNDNPISNIIFIDENSVITSDKNNIKFWNLKGGNQ